MAQISLKNISKSFGKTKVLNDISLDVAEGEFISLVGQSGCGKSTLLRILAGLETADAGEILINGNVVNQAAPKDRSIAMVFQDYALYPHMSVGENMSMPLLMARLPLAARLPLINLVSSARRKEMPDIGATVEKVAKKLRIDHLLDRKPAQLSGGQRQRVALGRALVRDPKIFLMDEPLSNLDAKLRVQVRREITELHAESGLTFIYVTHDQTEAMTMSDRVALMQQGRFLQVGTPNQLYTHPDNVDVSRFIGSPEINMVKATTSTHGLKIDQFNLPIKLQTSADKAIQIGIRPEAFSVCGVHGLESATGNDHEPELTFKKVLIEDLGHEVLIHGDIMEIGASDIRIRVQKNSLYRRDDTFGNIKQFAVTLNLDTLLFFDADGRRVQRSEPLSQKSESLLKVEAVS